LYTSSTGLEPVADAFMQKYPFIRMEIFSSRGEPLAQRALAEARAGRLNGDVLKTNLFTYDDLKGLLAPFNSPGARFDRVPNAASIDYTGIVFAYSTARVAPGDVPRRAEDLLHPRWTRNIATHAPPGTFPGRWVGALIEHLGEPATRDFLRRLGDQKPYFFTDAQSSRRGLLAGEWDISTEGVTTAVRSMRAGEPIGWVALDPTTVSPDVAGLFSQAPHPYAALLFLDFAFSSEGQQLFTHAQGSITPEEIERREKEGVKLPPRITIQSPADAAKLDGWTGLYDELVVRR
jgi:iron(III) transport system substrate-binding protein